MNAFHHDLHAAFKSYPAASNYPNELRNDFKKNPHCSIVDKHAPVKQRRVKSEFKPWITSEVKHFSHHRDYLKRQAIRLRSVYYETANKKCKSKITNLIRASKENYSRAKLSNSNNDKESSLAKEIGIIKEMNNGNDLHSMTKLSGWLRSRDSWTSVTNY